MKETQRKQRALRLKKLLEHQLGPKELGEAVGGISGSYYDGKTKTAPSRYCPPNLT